MGEAVIRVKLYTVLAELAGREELELKVPVRLRVKDLLERISRGIPDLHGFIHKRSIIVLHNNNALKPDDTIMLGDGDLVELLPPSAGG